jgi:transposase
VSDRVEQAAIDAGLRHELSWAAVWRILANLPDEDNPCPYCGGRLDRWLSEPSDRAWRCAACGRLHQAGLVA